MRQNSIRTRANVSARGFTLIELLVVVAVIAILIGLLLPALGRARASAWQAKALSTQRQMAVGMINYTTSNQGFYPGLNTTGIRLEKLAATKPDEFDQKSNLPTSNWDWMTSCLDDQALPVGRAQRLYTILKEYGDPAMREISRPGGAMSGGSGSQKVVDYSTEKNGYPGISFLMPSGFVWGGETVDGTGTTKLQWGTQTNDNNPGTPPKAFVPRIERVGGQSKKVCIADGFLYYDSEGSEFDARIWTDPGSTYPSCFGNFVDSGPIRKDSIAYGEKGGGNEPDGAQIKLTYRHGSRMNVTFFDGHGEVMEQKESRNPIYWYPSGSTLGTTNAHKDSRGFLPGSETNPKIP